MTDDLDAQLRRALKPVEAPEGFSGRLIARLTDRQRQTRRRRYVMAAAAASVLLALGIYLHGQQQRQQLAGLEARRQVIEALRLTDQKLDIAYQTVKDESGT